MTTIKKKSAARPTPLPVPGNQFVREDEANARRISERNFNLTFEQTRAATLVNTAESSLALRRFQFLLMGASGP